MIWSWCPTTTTAPGIWPLSTACRITPFTAFRRVSSVGFLFLAAKAGPAAIEDDTTAKHTRQAVKRRLPVPVEGLGGLILFKRSMSSTLHKRTGVSQETPVLGLMCLEPQATTQGCQEVCS